MKHIRQRGIIGTIVLLIIALIVLGYYNISLKSLVESPTIQENLKYALNLVIWIGTNLFWWLVNFVKTYSPHQ